MSPDVDTGWIRAIDLAQGILQNDPHIGVPVLLMHSDRSVKEGDPSATYGEADAVLDVEDISRYDGERNYRSGGTEMITFTGAECDTLGHVKTRGKGGAV